jgi:hypothetical protein|tara:strand:- start:268 stop:1446 length:1179 start_codon:yes stop_codon:yes gene_type:complete
MKSGRFSKSKVTLASIVLGLGLVGEVSAGWFSKKDKEDPSKVCNIESEYKLDEKSIKSNITIRDISNVGLGYNIDEEFNNPLLVVPKNYNNPILCEGAECCLVGDVDYQEPPKGRVLSREIWDAPQRGLLKEEDEKSKSVGEKIPKEVLKLEDKLVKEINKSKYIASKKNSWVKVGLRNETATWSYGPEFNNLAYYIQAGTKVFSDWIRAYVEVSGNNPVIREGFERPNDSGQTFDISPNTYIAGVAGGVQVTIYGVNNDKWKVLSEIRYETISEFDDTQNWTDPANSRTDFHIDGITTIGGKTWVERNFKNWGVSLGVGGKFTEASGDALTYFDGSSDEHKARFDRINQRDKGAINGLVGVHYNITDNWALNLDGEAGTGSGGEVSFSVNF